MLRLVLALVVVAATQGVATAQTRAVPQTRSDALLSYSPVVKRVVPAVVNV